MDQILWCDHSNVACSRLSDKRTRQSRSLEKANSNETYFDSIFTWYCFSAFHNIKFEYFLGFWHWQLLWRKGLLLGSHQWKSLDPIKRIQRSPTMTNMSGPFTFESLQRTCAHELYQTKIRLNYFVPLNCFGPQFQESVNKHHITCLGKHLFLLVKDSL